MNINFIGTGIKREVEDIIFLICENVKTRISQINSEIDVEYNFRTLNDKLYVDLDQGYEVVFAESTININNLNIIVDLKKLTYKDDKVNIFININYNNTILGEIENVTEEQQDFMYEIKIAISKSVSKYVKSINWIYDDQNGYMSQKLYFKIYELENKFRGLINEYMLKQFGEDWFLNKICSEYNSKSQEYGEWYNSRYKNLKYIKSELFNLQTKDLITMLQESYENDELNKVGKAVNSIKNILKDNADRIINKDIVDSQTLWEKYFKPILGEDMEEIWIEFSNMRNIIAHNKVISMEFYHDIGNRVDELNTIIENSREMINSRIKSQEEKLVKQQIAQAYEDFALSEVDFSSYDDDNDVIDKLFNNGELGSLYCVIEEKAKELETSYYELRGLLDELDLDYEEGIELIEFKDRLLVVNDALNEDNKIIISELINITNKVDIVLEIANYLSKIINNKINQLDKCIESIAWSDDFIDEKNIFFHRNLNNDLFSVDINGWFCTGWGESSEIYIDYTKNKQIIERGGIDIAFGDYEQHEDGYHMPTEEQKFDINVEGLYKKISDDVCGIISSINDIYEKISNISY